MTAPDPATVPFEVVFEQPQPWLLVLRCSGIGSPNEQAQEALDQASASHRPGTHLCLALSPQLDWPPTLRRWLNLEATFLPYDADASNTPAELIPLARTLGVPRHHVHPGTPWSVAVGAAALLPPARGGITWILPPGVAPDAFVTELSRSGQREVVADAVAALVEDRSRLLERTLAFDRGHCATLSQRFLDVGRPDHEAAFSYSVMNGGERTTTVVSDAATEDVPDCGRLVRGHDEFTIPLAQRTAEIRQALVVARRTAPEDFGKILRVTLNEAEDLGPWHLGNEAVAGTWAVDLYRIPPELWQDFAEVRLRLACDAGTSVAAYSYQFFLEAEPDGMWLTELDPIDELDAPLTFDRSRNGGPLCLRDELFLRGFGFAGSTRATFEVPAGYAWFDSRVGMAPDSKGRAVFRILVNGEEQFRSRSLSRDEDGEPARCAIPGACQLTLQVECTGDEDGGTANEDLTTHWCAPVLIRPQT